MNCPECQSPRLQWRGKRNALYPAGLVFANSVPIAMLHRLSSPHEFRCRDCGREFGVRTTLGRVALVLLIMLVASLFLMVGAFIFVVIH